MASIEIYAGATIAGTIIGILGWLLKDTKRKLDLALLVYDAAKDKEITEAEFQMVVAAVESAWFGEKPVHTVEPSPKPAEQPKAVIEVKPTPLAPPISYITYGEVRVDKDGDWKVYQTVPIPTGAKNWFGLRGQPVFALRRGHKLDIPVRVVQDEETFDIVQILWSVKNDDGTDTVDVFVR